MIPTEKRLSAEVKAILKLESAAKKAAVLMERVEPESPEAESVRTIVVERISDVLKHFGLPYIAEACGGWATSRRDRAAFQNSLSEESIVI